MLKKLSSKTKNIHENFNICKDNNIQINMLDKIFKDLRNIQLISNRYQLKCIKRRGLIYRG